MDKLFTTYGLTGNTAIDALIISTLVPFLISYATIVFTFIKEYLVGFIASKCMNLYTKIKKRTLGEVDMCLCISDDKNIYSTIKNIIFSVDVKSDTMNSKTLGMLELLTDSKQQKYNFIHDQNKYDMFLDSYNDIVVQKKAGYTGCAISKKYFQFEHYYIVVSENKKADFSHMFDDDMKDMRDIKDIKENITYFIMFEAIRTENTEKDDNIITKFLNTRFNLKLRIPYKYKIKVINKSIINKLTNRNDYIDNNGSLAQLSMSDPTSIFLSHPSVKEFYSNKQEEIRNMMSSSLIVDHRASSLNVNTLNKDLVYLDMADNDKCTFEPRFKSILKYFFGNEYKMEKIESYFFMFKDNKIILYLYYRIDDNQCESIVLIVSFQEVLTQNDITKIFEQVLQPSVKKHDNDGKIVIYNYKNGQWPGKHCDSKTCDTLYLPVDTYKLLTDEMEKFMCFEKIYSKIGVPYKKGFLLHGPPGSGKTSTVKALAHKYNLPIFIIDVNNSCMNDETIVAALNSISGTGARIVLFEDIDSAFADKEKLNKQIRITEKEETLDDKDQKSQTKCLTYSGLLNALDGVQTSQHGTIVIMTTNYREKLGKALIRPGRIDYAIELTYCDHHQIVEMTSNIIKSSYNIVETMSSDNELSKYTFRNPYTNDEFVDKVNTFADLLIHGQKLSTIEPCKLQVYILKYLDNVDNIFNNYQELLTPSI